MFKKPILLTSMITIIFLISLTTYCRSDEKKVDDMLILKLLDSKEYDKASAEIEAAFKIEPKCAFCYFAQGVIMERQANRSQAMQKYNKAIELDPDTPQYYYYRGNLNVNMALLQKSDFNTDKLKSGITLAIEDFTKAINLKPVNIDLYYRERGSAYLSISEYSKALLDFQEILKLNKKDTPLLCKVGECYLKLNDPDKALKFLLEADPSEIDDSCMVNTALAYSIKNEKENAIKYLKMAINKNEITANYGISKSDPGWNNIRETEIFRNLKESPKHK